MLPRKLIRIIFTTIALLLSMVMVCAVGYSQPTDGSVISGSGFQAHMDRSKNRSLAASTVSYPETSPTLRFTTSSLTVNEADGTTALEIELVEANGQNIEAEVAFLAVSSSASLSDIEGYTTRRVSFTAQDPIGTIKTVTIALSADSDYEGTETALFELQNNTSGSITAPAQLELVIQDDDIPKIVINEIHADPDERWGDADGNGVVDSGDEFIEFINDEFRDVDLSGWTVSDNEEVRHTFPEGSIIPAGGAVVLFGNNDVQSTGSFGGALVQSSNESGGLSLDDNGDSIELRDSYGNIVFSQSYSSIASDNQSITRNRDGSGSFVKHSGAGGAAGAVFSPGTKIDGSSFGSKFALGIRGTEGWQMISTPTKNTTFNDLFSDFWMQGLTGSDAPNEVATIYKWDEKDGGVLLTPAEMSEELEAGVGYVVYLFEDNEFNVPGIQGGFPKIINSDQSENNSTVTLEVSATDHNDNSILDGSEGWNLIGNPFGSDLSVDALLSAFESVDSEVNAHLYIWDQSAGAGNGAFIPLSSGDTIAPFQAFWVRYTSNSGVRGTVTLNKRDLIVSQSSELYKESNSEQIDLTLSLDDGNQNDRYTLTFNNRGNVGLDRYDAFKLFSLNPEALNLYSLSGDLKLMKNVLPVDEEFSLEIPVDFDAPGRESLTMVWNGLDDIPDRWSVSLFDTKLNKEIDLRSVSDYRFDILGINGDTGISDNYTFSKPQLNKSKSKSEPPRFILSISSAVSGEIDTGEIPESVKLNPNYPNPFNPATTISYELKEDSEVLLSIWNIVGQKVVTLVDGMKEAGEHTANWNASEMPSGIYIAQLEVSGEVFIRKMTLIK